MVSSKHRAPTHPLYTKTLPSHLSFFSLLLSFPFPFLSFPLSSLFPHTQPTPSNLVHIKLSQAKPTYKNQVCEKANRLVHRNQNRPIHSFIHPCITVTLRPQPFQHFISGFAGSTSSVRASQLEAIDGIVAVTGVQC